MSSGSLTDALWETLELFDGSGAPLTTTEAADRLELGRRSTYERLERLVDHGEIETKSVGANGRVWWRPRPETTDSLETGHGVLGDYRERDLVERILDVAPVNIGVVSPDGSVLRANHYVERALARGETAPEEYAMGEWDIYRDGEYVPLEDRPYMQVFETGEPVSEWECQLELPSGEREWFSISAVPMEHDGEVEQVVTCAENITQLKEQSRRLEREREDVARELGEVFERIDDAFAALDEQWRYTHVNEHAEELLQLDAGELLGMSVWELFPETVGARFEEECRCAVETNESVTFEEYYAPLEGWFEVRAYPSESGLSFYFNDISERKARERELEQYETVVETVEDGIYVTDAEQRYQLVNDAYCELVGYSREELLGSHISKVVDEDVLARAARIREDRSPGETGCIEFDLSAADGETHTVETRYTLRSDTDGGFAGSVGVLRDVTERRERERELEEYETIVETMDEGVYILDEDGEFVFVNEAYCEQTGYDREALLGSPASLVVNEETIEEATDLRAEMGMGNRQNQRLEADIVRSTGETIHAEATFAFLERPDKTYRIGVVRDVTERVQRERELDRQHRRLTALNHLHEVIGDVTDAVIEQSTREEIEATVCERLAAVDSYKFAWIGEADTSAKEISLRTEAGVEGYFEGLEPTMDPSDPRSDGPAVRALRTLELQVVTDVHEEFPFDEWRETAREFGYRSLAAIPITHDTVLYGVLCVYAPQPGAFAGEERDVVQRLGEIVGHAIAAVEREHALTSDEVVELDFRVPNALDALDLPQTSGGRITFDRSVPVGDGAFLFYGTVTDDMHVVLDAFVDVVPHWESVRILGGDRAEGVTRFEARLVDPPVLEAVTNLGGYMKQASIEDDDYLLRIHLSPSGDARQVIDMVREAYPTIQMVTRRQVTRESESPVPFSQVLTEELTERPGAALEAGYFAGYFQWPRETKGEAVAESLSISPATFHQHLRAGQRKLLELALDDSTPA